MKTRILMITVTVLMLATGSTLAQMGGDHMGGGHMGGSNNSNNPGPGPGPGPGQMPGPVQGHMGYGMGYGMNGAGGMISGMMGNTISYGYQDILEPIDTPDEARLAIQAFLDFSNSGLQISELWEYDTVYKAELSDAAGAKAFDLIADKFTGAVSPEMGFSMMMNASYGKGLYNMPKFGKNLTVTQEQATSIAQSFLTDNVSVLVGYTLEAPEIYPGYYKFHTKVGAGFGMDIMVNGYNGGIWMNTLLGVPVAKY